MKNKIFSVVKYNLEKNIRNKWFIILNILLFLVTLVGLNFSTVKTILKDKNIQIGEKTEIYVNDSENIIYSLVEERLKDNEDVNLIKETETKEYTKENVTKEQIIVIVSKEADEIKGKIISQEGVEAKYVDIIEESIKTAKQRMFALDNNISIEELNKLDEAPNIERIMLGVDNTDTDKKYTMQSVFNYIVFFILLLILSKIANDVSQEKISKSIDYVLTSISAKGYLVAKILSVNLTFIIQFIFTFLYLIVSMLVNSLINMYMLNSTVDLANTSVDMSSIAKFIDTNLIIYLVIVFVYLIFTIFLLSIIQAVLSSKTTNINEASNATILLVTVNLIIYFLSTFFVTPLKAPSIITYIISCIPICSMYFIPTMVLISQANIIQVIIATVILIVSVFVVLKYAAVWFKNGVLDYTNKKTKVEVKPKDEVSVQKEKIAKSEYAQIGYVIGFSVILCVILQLGLAYVLQIFAGPIYSIFNRSISLENINSILQIIAFAVSLLIPALFVMLYVEKQDKKEKVKKQKVDLKTTLKYVLISLPIVLVVQIFVSFVSQKLGVNYDILDKVDMFNDTSILGKILFFIQVAILPAIFEELYVRKALLKYTNKYSTIFAIITTSLVFSVIHFNISQMIFAFIMGIILSIVALKTNSILGPGIIHFLNNGYAALIMIFENNLVVSNIITIIYFILIAIGVILILKEVIKNKGKVKIFKKEEMIKDTEYAGVKKYRYIFYDYTFIIACISSIVLLLAMQKLLTIL